MRAVRSRVFRLLFVCTGNQCRSPVMERMAGLLLATCDATFDVDSAGTRGPSGMPLHPLTAEALARRGVPVVGHRSQLLTAALVERADLVLTAERAHRVSVLSVMPTAVDRTFTLVEFARLAESAVPLGATDPLDLVAAAASLRNVVRGQDPKTDDIFDPVDGGAAVHEAMLTAVQGAVVPMADALQAVAERSGKQAQPPRSDPPELGLAGPSGRVVGQRARRSGRHAATS